MADYSDEIAKIETEIRETPYHKGTEHHIGKLRARLARLKDRQLEEFAKAKGGGGGGGFSIKKEGDATVVLVGPPSSGKSTLINLLTNAESKVAPYAFTTVSVIPGMLKYKDAYIQIFDIPGLIEGASKGKGRGKEVISVVRGSDLLLLLTDVQRAYLIKSLKDELYEGGIRINQSRPNILISKKAQGGLNIQTNIKQPFDKETIKEIALEFGLKNADIVVKERLTFERLFDAFSQNRVFIPAISVINKIDIQKPKEEKTQDGERPIMISANKKIGIEELKEALWTSLKLVRVFLVRPDDEPNFKHPIIMKQGDSLGAVAEKIGSEFAEGKKLARIWGPSAHHPGQEVPLSTKVVEGLQVRFI
jgi:small GTP-binding protein